MSWNFKFTLIFALSVLSVVSHGSIVREKRTVRSILRAFGMGPWCIGCPSNYCDDDPNIIHGYCCGCARFTDHLPVTCTPSVRCPLNTYQLCLNYEYMMQCCC